DAPPDSVFVDLVRRMIKKGQKFNQGYSHSQIDEISKRLETPVPPDLREFWSIAVPVGKYFDGAFGGWHEPSKQDRNWQQLRHAIVQDIMHDVWFSYKWYDCWGERPDTLKKAYGQIMGWAETWPKMILLGTDKLTVCEPVLPATPVIYAFGSDWWIAAKDLATDMENMINGVEVDDDNFIQKHPFIGSLKGITIDWWPENEADFEVPDDYDERKERATWNWTLDDHWL
ncbi:MAG: hypothetical protein L3J82_08450, partial [Planctomycetes bacterium]|nr:hypothetical protein [Planctomycetota bacterium]